MFSCRHKLFGVIIPTILWGRHHYLHFAGSEWLGDVPRTHSYQVVHGAGFNFTSTDHPISLAELELDKAKVSWRSKKKKKSKFN